MDKMNLFIVIEGNEGAGKSTQVQLLADRCRKDGYEVVIVRDPGGTIVGDKIRDILKDKNNAGKICSKTELLLMQAARAQLVSEVISPALSEGKIVISDRFTDSSYVYQGCGRQMGEEIVAQTNLIAIGELKPDLTILLHTSEETAKKRVSNRGNMDRFELEQSGFLDRVAKGYNDLKNSQQPNTYVVDGDKSITEVSDYIYGLVEGWVYGHSTSKIYGY